MLSVILLNVVVPKFLFLFFYGRPVADDGANLVNSFTAVILVAQWDSAQRHSSYNIHVLPSDYIFSAMLSAIMLIFIVLSILFWVFYSVPLCWYALLSVIMLSVIVLSVTVLSVILLSVILLSVILLSVLVLSVIVLSVNMLSIVILSVVAPIQDRA
jgi:hypothetical protein